MYSMCQILEQTICMLKRWNRCVLLSKHMYLRNYIHLTLSIACENFSWFCFVWSPCIQFEHENCLIPFQDSLCFRFCTSFYLLDRVSIDYQPECTIYLFFAWPVGPAVVCTCFICIFPHCTVECSLHVEMYQECSSQSGIQKEYAFFSCQNLHLTNFSQSLDLSAREYKLPLHWTITNFYKNAFISTVTQAHGRLRVLGGCLQK